MATHDWQNNDFLQRCLLGCSAAGVLSMADERKLLLELADHRRQLAAGAGRSDGTEGESAADAAPQRIVHDPAASASRIDTATDAARAIARRYQEIRTTLAMANVRLVAHIAKRYKNRGISASDLIQEGVCGLLVAIDRFDPTNSGRLATYAVWWIRQAIQRAVAAGAYPVRLNPKQLRRLSQAQFESDEVVRDLFSHGGQPDSGRPHTIRYALAAVRPQFSLDAPCGDDGHVTLMDRLVVSRSDQPDEPEENVGEYVTELLRTLGPREQLVLKLRFGLGGESRHSLSQVSLLVGVSKERVRQIQDRALQKLRAFAEMKERLQATDPIR